MDYEPYRHQEVKTSDSPRKSTVEDPLTRLADILSQRWLQDTLPFPGPEVLSGDLLQYPVWLKSIENIIERERKCLRDCIILESTRQANLKKRSVSYCYCSLRMRTSRRGRSHLTDLVTPSLLQMLTGRKLMNGPRFLPTMERACASFQISSEIPKSTRWSRWKFKDGSQTPSLPYQSLESRSTRVQVKLVYSRPPVFKVNNRIFHHFWIKK